MRNVPKLLLRMGHKTKEAGFNPFTRKFAVTSSCCMLESTAITTSFMQELLVMPFLPARKSCSSWTPQNTCPSVADAALTRQTEMCVLPEVLWARISGAHLCDWMLPFTTTRSTSFAHQAKRRLPLLLRGGDAIKLGAAHGFQVKEICSACAGNLQEAGTRLLRRLFLPATARSDDNRALEHLGWCRKKPGLTHAHSRQIRLLQMARRRQIDVPPPTRPGNQLAKMAAGGDLAGCCT